jgi:hypothetical protein
MAIASFAPTATIVLDAGATSSNAALPTTGTPTVAMVTNTGAAPVWVQLGGSSVTASPSTSLAVMPGAQVALTIGANTYIAVVAAYAVEGVNVTVGS